MKNIHYSKLSDKAKVLLLEQTVLDGTLDELKEVLEHCGTFEMTARALGFACRFRTVDVVKLLVEGGASFFYRRSAALQSKYSICRNPKYSWCPYAQFELMTLAASLRDPDLFGDLRNTTDIITSSTERACAPLESRLENLRYISSTRKSRCDTSALLYYAILWDQPQAVAVLREQDIVFSSAELGFLEQHAATRRRNQLLERLEEMEPESRIRVLDTILDVLKAQGKQLSMTARALKPVLFDRRLTERILEEGNCESLDQRQVLADALEAGSAATLALLLERGFLKQPQALEGLVTEMSARKQVEHAAVLLAYQERVYPPEKRMEDEEKKRNKQEAQLKTELKMLETGVIPVSELKKSWKYEKMEGGGVRILGYKGQETEVVVPARIGKEPVKEIGPSAFSPEDWDVMTRTKELRKQVTSVVIPEGIKKIGKAAFYKCSNLADIVLPEGVKKIEDAAFYGCSNLTRIVIPDSVTQMGERTFYECTSLAEITLPKRLTSIGAQAFYRCKALTGITLPKGTATIGKEAFKQCESLAAVTFSDGLKRIEEGAFSGCTCLTDIVLPEGLTVIENTAFSGCSGATQIILPETLTSLGANAFFRCSGVTSLRLPKSLTEIGFASFSNCTHLTHLTISEGVAEIGARAFAGCERLSDVAIDPANPYFHREQDLVLSADGSTAVFAIGNRTEFHLPKGVTRIGPGAFAGCTGLTSVTIPEGVTEIGEGAFYGCLGLTGVTIPEGVAEIGAEAFADCAGLTSMTIPKGVTEIGGWTFFGCKGLTSVTIPGSVISIHENAFGYLWEGDCHVTIHAPAGSYAEQYAMLFGVPFVAL